MVNFKPPYSPSWVDQFIGWVDRIPIPNWLFYVLLVIGEFVIYHVIGWVTGNPAPGQIDTLYSYIVVYNVVTFAVIDYIRHIAVRAFDEFSPALGVLEDQAARLKYQLTVLPAMPTLIATIIGAAFSIFTLTLAARTAANASSFNLPAFIFGTIGFALSGPMALLFFRQLIMVNRIHRSALRINLFQFNPLYAFSSLTSRIGLIGIAITYFNIVIDPTVFNNPLLIVFNGLLLLLSLAAFVLPLSGMHQRLSQAKKRLITENDQRFESVFNELNLHIDERHLDQVDALTKTMTSLTAQRGVLNKIPTWPWRTETFRGFATTLLLPILIWLITRLLLHFGF